MGQHAIGLKPVLAVYLLLIAGCSVALVGLAAIRLQRHALLSQKAQVAHAFLEQLQGSLSRSCGPDLLSCPDLNLELQDLRLSLPGLKVLLVADRAGRVLGGSAVDKQVLADFGSQESAGEGLHKYRLVEHNTRRFFLVGQPLASDPPLQIKAAFSMAQTEALISKMAASVVLYGFLVLLAVGVIAWMLLYRLIVRPIDKLLVVAERVFLRGDLSDLLQAERGSEYGRLGFSLGRMARRIEGDQQQLKSQIAELEKLNHELAQAQQAMIRQEKLASVGFLAAGLAHEVGNPIAAIGGYVGMLRTEQVPEDQQKDILGRVEREIERIDKIIRDLLSYSRPGKGEAVPCDLIELIADATDLLRPQKKFKQIEFVSQDDAMPWVLCDPDLVRQVLVNLMFNALDAVDEGGHIWVRVHRLTRRADGDFDWGSDKTPGCFELGVLHRVRPPADGQGLPVDQEVVVVSVVDDGHGINSDRLGQIFDPFYSTKEPGQGTGLGLCICLSAIHAQGGEIWAWSREGLGTQLAFWLPEAG
jgi:signal transduction histidine kinase